MRELNRDEYILCSMQARLFEKSVKELDYSSYIFIRRFMNSNIVLSFDEERYLYMSFPYKSVYEELDEEYGKSEYGSVKLPELVMNWIGYMYRIICIRYGLYSKKVYKLFPVKFMLSVYKGFHTMDPKLAASKMMEIKEIDVEALPNKVYFYDNYVEPSESDKALIEANLKKGLKILKELQLKESK